MQTIHAALVKAKQLGLARADAEILLSARCGLSRAALLAFGEKEIDASVAADLERDFAACAEGMPIAYLLGVREFFGLELSVSADVLVPRPDTETLVETVLALPLAHANHVLDLGTGSGAIALALKANRAPWQVSASDQSEAALAIAKRNAEKHQLAVHFKQGSWFGPWQNQQFDVIASNPPYIAVNDAHLTALRFEPMAALVAAKQGMADLQHLIDQAPNYLNPDGWLVLEHGYDQRMAVEDLMGARGFIAVRCVQDLGGNDRVSVAQWR